MKKLILLFCTCILSACVAIEPILPDDISSSQLDAETGVFIGSYANVITPPRIGYSYFYFRNIASGEVHEVSDRFKPTFFSESVQGSQFAFVLPVGKYEFYNYHAVLVRMDIVTGADYSLHWYAEQDFSISFNVEANKISYIGELKLVPILREKVVKQTMPPTKMGQPEKVKDVIETYVVGPTWEISNQQDRDISSLEKRYPTLNWGNINVIIPIAEDISTPNLVFLK